MADREGRTLLEDEQEEERCYQVWLTGNKVQLRYKGSTSPKKSSPEAEAAITLVTEATNKQRCELFRGLRRQDMKVQSLVAGVMLAMATPALSEPDWKAVGQALGKEGTLQNGVYRVSFPRSDLNVTLDGVQVKPGFALGSWLAFKEEGDRAVVMGDLVLTQEEVNPVMKRLAEGGIEITALHNHLLRANPNPMYMHVHGHGDPVKLAGTLRQALQSSSTPIEVTGSTQSGASEQSAEINTEAVANALGHMGKMDGGIYKVSIPRAKPVRVNGQEVPPSMGSAIAINFQPTGDGKAAVTGDFVLTAEEVNPVLQALRQSGIEVSALHNHMLEEEPRLFFMHFWAHDDAQSLARGLGTALNKIDTRRG